MYADDLVSMTANAGILQSFKNYLSYKFSMIDLNGIKLCLGFKFARSNDEITYNQSEYDNEE